MIEWNRRQIAIGGLLTIVPMGMCASVAHAEEYGGCWVPEARSADYADHQPQSALRDDLVAQSGVDDLEEALVQTLDMLSDMFGVLPGFSFYRERGTPNAKATSVDLTRDRPDGTVLLGTKLLGDLLALPEHPDAAVVAVCAHEFAHIMSYSNGTIAQLSPAGRNLVFRSEQYADFMAGYFAGRRKLDDPSFPAVVFATTTSMYGGATHGDADQRADAVQEGFLCAYMRKYEPQLAARRALEFALGQPETAT